MLIKTFAPGIVRPSGTEWGAVPVLHSADTTTASVFSTSLSIDVPANTADGTLLLVIGASRDSDTDNASLTPPGGWTEVIFHNDDPMLFLGVWRRIAASEPGSYTWGSSGGSGNRDIGLTMHRITGHDASAPIGAIGNAVNLSDVTTLDAPSVEALAGNPLIMRVMTPSASISAPNVDGHTQLAFVDRSGASIVQGMNDGPASPGTISAATVTWSTARRARAVTFLVNPPEV